MNLRTWETTIQQIAHEVSFASNKMGQRRILTVWRAKLEKEPTSLLPYQIDEIVLEVRARLQTTAGEITQTRQAHRQPSGTTPA
jgi:hypothetical protein